MGDARGVFCEFCGVVDEGLFSLSEVCVVGANDFVGEVFAVFWEEFFEASSVVGLAVGAGVDSGDCGADDFSFCSGEGGWFVAGLDVELAVGF